MVMYDRCTPGQQNGLTYGARLRCIGAIGGLLGNYRGNEDINPFTQEEITAIEEICQNAKARAKETFERTKIDIEDAKARSGTATEHRQYTGK